MGHLMGVAVEDVIAVMIGEQWFACSGVMVDVDGFVSFVDQTTGSGIGTLLEQVRAVRYEA